VVSELSKTSVITSTYGTRALRESSKKPGRRLLNILLNLQKILRTASKVSGLTSHQDESIIAVLKVIRAGFNGKLVFE